MTGPREEIPLPERYVRFCGADCRDCDSYERFLAGDWSGLVNPETAYRCCWLPKSYPEGRDCPIRTCCEEKGVSFCGRCDQYEQCEQIKALYGQPGYDELRRRMLREIEGTGRDCRLGSGSEKRPKDRPETNADA